jgi:MerR family transcriptional regulator, light-induced transcriptional regulator
VSSRRATRSSEVPSELGEGHTIKVVAERTGLEMGTLRAWERRYGFPSPSRRTGSNRRLYSSEDLARLLVIKRLLERGYRVGDVVQKALGELEELAARPPNRSTAVTFDAPPSAVNDLMALVVDDRVNELEAQLRLSAAALGPRRFVTDLVHPFAVGIGRAWAEGRISVRQEHVTTECLVTQIRQMLATYQDIHATPLVLLATLPSEQHTLPLQMVALYLVLAGAKPRLLGGPTPPQQIAESASALRADAVGIGITLTESGAQTRRDLVSLRSTLAPDIQLWLGGSSAAGLEVGLEGTRLVDSWPAIDRAVVECRAASVLAAASSTL